MLSPNSVSGTTRRETSFQPLMMGPNYSNPLPKANKKINANDKDLVWSSKKLNFSSN